MHCVHSIDNGLHPTEDLGISFFHLKKCMTFPCLSPVLPLYTSLYITTMWSLLYTVCILISLTICPTIPDMLLFLIFVFPPAPIGPPPLPSYLHGPSVPIPPLPLPILLHIPFMRFMPRSHILSAILSLSPTNPLTRPPHHFAVGAILDTLLLAIPTASELL